MKFEEFWQDMIRRGTTDHAANRSLVMAAWDAALCAATASAFDAGKMRPAGEVMRGISSLHTWAPPDGEGGEP